jgi:hypothetical protein
VLTSACSRFGVRLTTISISGSASSSSGLSARSIPYWSARYRAAAGLTSATAASSIASSFLAFSM